MTVICSLKGPHKTRRKRVRILDKCICEFLSLEAQAAHPLYCIFCRFLSCQSLEPTSSPSQYSMSHLVSQMGLDFLTKKPYSPPSWASHLNPIPSHSYSLSHLPTPIHKWNLPNLPKNTEVWLKREDLSGMQLSGNKARKLEFLLADAVAQGADCVITLGGIQSNHCRSTAVAARYLNLDSYLILFTSEAFVDQDPGLTGNLLVERLVGAHVELILETEFANIGSAALMNHLKEKLIREGRRPYVIATGGSDSLGTWGYIEAIREIEQQLLIENADVKFDDIVVACGSGGTVAGLSLGSWMSSLKAKVHAFSIYYEPDYLYEIVQGLIDSLEADVASRDIVNIQDLDHKRHFLAHRITNGSFGLTFCISDIFWLTIPELQAALLGQRFGICN